MQNSPTIVAAPPPRPAGQITVIPFPPPHPFDGAPSSIFQITVLPFPQPPPFAAPPSSVDLSPLEFLLALLAVVTIPALIYTFIFAFGCPSHRSRRDPSASEPSVSSEASHREIELPIVDAGVKYRKDAHAKEISGECTVCLSVFAEGEEIRQLSACKHSFHASCIDLWLSNHSSCPICRATIAVIAATKPNGDLDESHGERDESNIV